MSEVKKEEKGILGKIKDKVLPDEDERAAIISTFVRLGVLVWSGGILTLNYVTIPGWEQDKIDPTFIASVFTGVTATFGIQAGGKKKNGSGGDSANISKKDMEMLIEKASQAAPTQTIKLEVPAVKITS
mgnify:CR=1 FL=1